MRSELSCERGKPLRLGGYFHLMSLDEKWDVRIERAVAKVLHKLPRKDSGAVEAVIVGMRDDPYYGDIQKIGGEENTWRRRVGSYRVSYEIYQDMRMVVVFKVKRRTSTTY